MKTTYGITLCNSSISANKKIIRGPNPTNGRIVAPCDPLAGFGDLTSPTASNHVKLNHPTEAVAILVPQILERSCDILSSYPQYWFSPQPYILAQQVVHSLQSFETCRVMREQCWARYTSIFPLRTQAQMWREH